MDEAFKSRGCLSPFLETKNLTITTTTIHFILTTQISYFISNFRISADAGCEVLYRLGEVADVSSTDPTLKYLMECK